MNDQTAMMTSEKPPLYWQAAAYCDERDVPFEDIEKVRTMLAVVEFRRRCEPYFKQAAHLESLRRPNWIKRGAGYVLAEWPEGERMLKQIQEMIAMEAKNLGLTVPAR